MSATNPEDGGTAPEADEQRPPPAQEDVAPAEGLFSDLKQLGGQFASTLRTGRQLLAAEMRLAFYSLLMIVALAVVVGLMVAAGWIFLGIAAAFFLVQQGGVPAALAVLLVACFSCLLAVAAGLWIVRLLRNLAFRHSRQALTGEEAVPPPASPENLEREQVS